MEKDPLPRWKKEFGEFRGDILSLLLSAHTYGVMDDAIRNNPNVENGDPVLIYVEIWYYHYLAATVRRHVREHPQSHGLVRLLNQVRQRPEVLGLTVEDVDWDLSRLEAGAVLIEAYADRLVAHLDRRGLPSPPTVKDAKDAVKVLASVFNKYERLLLDREPFDAELVLRGQWKNALDVAWRRVSVLPR